MAKVLLVDDEPDILLMLRMSFEDEGHEVVMAADGRMGLERLAEHHPDVVVLDMMMPVVDGWGVLEAMSVEGNKTPVVVVSAKSDPKSGVGGNPRAMLFCAPPAQVQLEPQLEPCRETGAMFSVNVVDKNGRGERI